MVKALFFGTPQIAVPYLQWLAHHTTVVGVVCRPDEPVGRGLTLTAPSTKVFAQEKKIPVFQPSGPWTPQIVQPLLDLKADLGIVVAYGRIMPEAVFTVPKLGCINIHFSLLPKYRGAAPMQWALINGETKTGVSAFWLDTGMDSGPLFHQKEISIVPEDDARSLRDKLVALGLTVLEDVIKDIEAARIVRKPQGAESTHAPLLKKETGQIDWTMPAEKIVNLVRGVCEWPGAQTRLGKKEGIGKKLKILKTSWDPVRCAEAKPGEIVGIKKDTGFYVQTGEGRVLVLSLQPEGKKEMSAWAFWQGARMKIGDKMD